MTDRPDPYGQVPPPPPGPTGPRGPYEAWAPPPRTGVPGWGWALIGAASAVLVLVGGFALVFAVGFGFSGPYYDEEGYDEADDYYVDQDAVLDAIEEPCAALEERAEEARPFAPGRGGPDDLAGLADAHRALATAIDGADPDEASQAMAADWRSIADALDAYAAALRQGDDEAAFSMPTEGGVPASERIYWGNDDCFVPNVVHALDPEVELFY